MKKLYILLGVCLLALQVNAQNCGSYPLVKPTWWDILNGGSGPTTFDLGLSEDSIDVTNDDQIRFVQGQDTSFEVTVFNASTIRCVQYGNSWRECS